MRIEVAKDKQTGFPCVRLPGEQEFISLFPVTKLQAEEWIWRNGVAFNDPSEFIAFFNRLEMRETSDQSPEAVQSLTRRPLPQQSSDTLLSIIATNLSVWSADEETHRPDVHFPTSNSEWGRLTRWLGGRIPRYQEWWVTLDDLRLIPSADIIQGVLSARIQWDRVVKDLLWKIKETLSRDEMGLPFMKAGLYELISGPEKFERLARYQRKECRPQVAGESPVWPTLNADWDGAESSIYRPLRQRTLPVVAVRLWYAEAEVTGKLSTGEYQSFEVEESHVEDPPSATELTRESEPSNDSGLLTSWFRPKPSANARREGILPAYVSTSGKMKYRCPFCHQEVEPATFMTKAHFCCYGDFVEATNPDGSKRREPVRKHSIAIPAREVDQVTRLYLDVAQKQPDSVHTIALGGFRKAGKTTWLLSLGGLMDYPDGDTVISQAFPRSWRYVHIPCSLHNFIEGSDLTDRKEWTEKMWLDGRLPPRNSEEAKAFRCPILFECSPRGKEQQLVLILDDIAGETLFKNMANNKNFPHIASTSDAIFFLPVDGIDNWGGFLVEFIKQMGMARTAGTAVDLKKINLILVISKIDQLKHGTRREKELFEGIVPRPYRFPRYKGKAGVEKEAPWGVEELKAYFDEMEEAHWRIGEWIGKYKHEIKNFTDRFGSVRYCGLSAFGFQPKEEPGVEEEYSLPFRPEPMRVVDPIFWLLKENRLVDF